MKIDKIDRILLIGHLAITAPIFIMIIVLPEYIFTGGVQIDEIIRRGAIAIVAILCMWIWWSYSVIKWQIWCYESLDEDEWLKILEINLYQARLLRDFPEIAFTKIRNSKDLEKLKIIYSKIEELKEIELIKTQLSTNNEVKYELNYWLILGVITILIIGCWIGTSLIYDGEILIGLLMVVVFIWIGSRIKYVKYMIRNDSFFVLNREYIKVKYQEISWTKIERIQVLKEEQILKIYHLEGLKNEHVTEVDLSMMKIDDMNRFVRELQVFGDRFLLNLPEE